MQRRRLATVDRHLDPRRLLKQHAHGPSPDLAAAAADTPAAKLRAFAADPEWAGQPVWMVNVLDLSDRAKYMEYVQSLHTSGLLEKAGARVVLSGRARTVVGRNSYNHLIIVEYKSPQAMVEMVTSEAYQESGRIREQGLRECDTAPPPP